MVKKLKVLLCLMVPAAIIYVAVLFGMPFYRYYAFESDARDVLRFEVQNEEKMSDKIREKAENLGIPLTESSIAVYQDFEGKYSAKVSWSETVSLLNLYSKRFDFRVDVGGEEMKKRSR